MATYCIECQKNKLEICVHGEPIKEKSELEKEYEEITIKLNGAEVEIACLKIALEREKALNTERII